MATNEGMSQAMTLGMRALVPIYEHMDARVEVDDEAGVYRAVLPWSDKVGSHVKTVHAAYQWAIAECLGGPVAMHTFGGLEDIFLVVKRVSIEFLAPARSELTAETRFDAEAQAAARAALEGGESTLELDIPVRDADGKEVARMEAVYLVRPRRA